MASMRIINPEAEDRRYKRIITVLFSAGTLGLSYLVFDYVQIMDRATLPLNSGDIDPIVALWQSEGLVYSFNVDKSELVVEEKKWGERLPEEKVGIITRLARYCAEKKQDDAWTLKVVGSRSFAVLGELNESGLHVN